MNESNLPTRGRSVSDCARFVGYGAFLGAVIGIAGVVTFCAISFVASAIDRPENALYELGIFLRMASYGAIFLAGPSAIGGAFFALVLYQRERAYEKPAALIGFLLGMLSGFALLFLAFALQPEGGCDSFLCWVGVAIQYVGIPTFSGAWYGLQIVRRFHRLR